MRVTGRVRAKRGFTLIEMLLVVVIILVLSGFLLKIMGLVGRKTATSRAEYELQQLRNALNEFYAEYGHYPPGTSNAAQNVEYEYEYSSPDTQSAWFSGTFLNQHNNPNDPENFFGDKPRSEGEYLYAAKKGWNLGYRYGLYSYLFKRSAGKQVHPYDEDTGRDIAAKERWSHFLTDLRLNSGWRARKTPPDIGGQAPYSNRVTTIWDPWERNYYYECFPPHLRYKLWSVGPDGKDGTDDDIGASTE